MGHRTLRFMLLSSASSQTIYIAPRKFFASNDGTYIPPDVRHRSISTKPDDQKLTSTAAEQILSDCLTFRAGERSSEDMSQRFHHHTSYDEKANDENYGEWLLKLYEFLSDFELALPRRYLYEFVDPRSSRIAIEFKEKCTARAIAPAIFFPPPPGGAIHAADPATDFDESLSIAQSRDPDAPSLVWPIRGLARLDRFYGEWRE